MQIFQKVKNGGRSICVSCIHRKVCKGIDNQPCIECNQFLNEDKKPQTNADRIRAMSAEELSKVLSSSCLGCVVKECHLHNYASYGCEQKFLQWLIQPAKED